MLNDVSRYVPDVSLFSGNGLSRIVYFFCQSDANPPGVGCTLDQFGFRVAGGTSFAAPAFAGIVALVNQKTNERQGNASYVLYSLAAQNGASCASSAAAVSHSACIFYDVVQGKNP